MLDYHTHPVQIFRSRRKSLTVRICPDGTIRVSAPLKMSDRQILEFLRQKDSWIENHWKKAADARCEAEARPITSQDIQRLKRRAEEVIPGRVAFFAKQMGVTYGKISFRSQKRRWGSCSAKGSLSFNCLMLLAPEHVQDYILVHELAHRKQMNHSAAFWREVSAVLPEYQQSAIWLKKNGEVLIARMLYGMKDNTT